MFEELEGNATKGFLKMLGGAIQSRIAYFLQTAGIGF